MAPHTPAPPGHAAPAGNPGQRPGAPGQRPGVPGRPGRRLWGLRELPHRGGEGEEPPDGPQWGPVLQQDQLQIGLNHLLDSGRGGQGEGPRRPVPGPAMADCRSTKRKNSVSPQGKGQKLRVSRIPPGGSRPGQDAHKK